MTTFVENGSGQKEDRIMNRASRKEALLTNQKSDQYCTSFHKRERHRSLANGQERKRVDLKYLRSAQRLEDEEHQAAQSI